MLQLNLPEHIGTELESAAELSGRTKAELATELLASHFEDQPLPLSALTEAQLTRFKESLEQIKRGELPPKEKSTTSSKTGSTKPSRDEPLRSVASRAA